MTSVVDIVKIKEVLDDLARSGNRAAIGLDLFGRGTSNLIDDIREAVKAIRESLGEDDG